MQLKNYEKVESTNIDFKEKVEYKKYKSWLKTVSAFDNTNGGILLFGVRNVDRQPIGLNKVIKDSEIISELINEKIILLPRYELKTFKEDCKDFIELKIGNGPRTPYYYNSDEDYFFLCLHKRLPLNIIKSTHNKIKKTRHFIVFMVCY